MPPDSEGRKRKGNKSLLLSRVKTALKKKRSLSFLFGPEEKNRKERKEGRMCARLIPFSNLHSCLLYGKAVKAREEGRTKEEVAE